MTSSYKCNSCGDDILRRDAANAVVREFDGVRVTVYVGKISDDDFNGGSDMHLCVKCIGKVLAEGAAPKPTDEIPF
jgi:hypothetical protein